MSAALKPQRSLYHLEFDYVKKHLSDNGCCKTVVSQFEIRGRRLG